MTRASLSAGLRAAAVAACALTLAGHLIAAPAGAGLVVNFEKEFLPDTIGPGSVSTLTFEITNPDPDFPLEGLTFTDILPAAVTIATPAQARSFCGGTLSAPAGGTTITFTDGVLATSSTCTIRVDVTSATPGVHMNVTGDLTSDAGNHGTAAADLTVATDRPGFAKGFSPSTVSFGGRSTLTFLVDNILNAAPAASLFFTDNLPAGMTVASPANASTTCGAVPSAVELVASPGTGTISFSYIGSSLSPGVPAGETCTISVDVVGGAVGSLGNTSGDLEATVGFSSRSCGKAAAVLTVTGGASEPILLQKDFLGDPVPPGGTTTLELTITNTSRTDSATGITFTDDLDAAVTGMTAVLPSSPDPPCGFGSSLTGSMGDTVLTFAGGTLAPEASCTFTVPVQVPAGVTPATYTNTTSTISADVGGDSVVGSAASALLFVVAYPELAKEFTDDPVGAGDTVTLEFTIRNTSTASAADDIEFVDLFPFLPDDPALLTFPPGDPCGPGSSLSVTLVDDVLGVVLTGGTLAQGGMSGDTCTFSITIDIPAGFPGGTYLNTVPEVSAELTDLPGPPVVTGPGGSDTLVVVSPVTLVKEFTDDPTPPGDTVTLELTLTHDEFAAGDATAIAFTDDLDATLSGLTAASVDSNGCAGSTVDISTPSLIDFSDGTLAPGASCVVVLTLAVPVGAPPGSHTNTTTDVVATVSGLTTIGNPATDDLRVAGLELTKEFLDDPTIPGDTVTLRFTLDNTSGTVGATGIFFTDDLAADLPGLAAVAPLPAAPCGGTLSGTSFLTYIGGMVAAGDSCSFDVTLLVPPGAADGDYTNVTSSVFSSVGVSEPAFDVLSVSSELLAFGKQFTDDPAVPGGTTTLELTLENLDPLRTASAIAFSDDLGAALAGLIVDSVLLDTCGGTPGGVGTSMFSYSGGTLAGGAICTVRLRLDVPPAPLAGDTFLNTTSPVSATIDGLPVEGAPASDTLRVLTLRLEKSFTGPVGPGGTSVLTFTLTNLDSGEAVGDLSFSDALPGGLVAVAPLPAAPCGPGSSIAGSTFLTFSGGSLGAGGTCSFDVTVQVPAGASPGTLVNTTSDLFRIGLSVGGPAIGTLGVEPPPLFAKSFGPGTIVVGGVSTLTFTIDNSGSGSAATGLDFTDSLPAGTVVASPAAASTTCTGGSLTAVAGSGTISYSGGSVPAGATCTVQADVTSGAPGSYPNVSGDLTSSFGSSGTASDILLVVADPLQLTKSFTTDPALPGGTVVLELTATNLSGAVSLADVAFSDDLGAVLAGLAAEGLPAADVCGAGSLLSGAAVISLTGGSLGPGASCTFAVTVRVPAAAPEGIFANTTSAVTGTGPGGPVAGPPATDDLEVAFLGFTKTFAPSPVSGGGVTTLTFEITNPDPDDAATDLAFTDDLDAVLPGLVATGLPQTDVCGLGSMITGTSLLSFTGGSLGPGASCTFAVQVEIPDTTPSDTYTNVTSPLSATVDGSSILGPPGAEASADLVVAGIPLVIPTLGSAWLAVLAALLAFVAFRRLRERPVP